MPEMTPEEKDSCGKNYRDISLAGTAFAQRRSSELSDEFTRLEVQIAAILIAFGGLSLTTFNELVKPGMPHVWILKVAYASSLLLLLTSLAMGLLHIKRKERWWDETGHTRAVRHRNWLEFTQKHLTYEEARAFHDGTALDKGIMTFSPTWTWVLQTVCLAVALVLIVLIFLMFLFHPLK